MSGMEILRKREEIIARVDSARRMWEWEVREANKLIQHLQNCCQHLRQDVSTSQLGVSRQCLDCGAEVE